MPALVRRILDLAYAAWSALVAHASLREKLAFVLLAVTVFVTAWSTMTVNRHCPEAYPVAIAYWSVVVILLAAKGANLTPSSDGSWLVGLVQALTAWSTVSWRRLGVAGLVSALLCGLSYVGLFRALPQVQVDVPADVQSKVSCTVGWSLITIECTEKPRKIWAPLGSIQLTLGSEVTDCEPPERNIIHCKGGATAPADPTTAAVVVQTAGPKEKLYVHFQRSKDLSYEREILDGFKTRLMALVGDRYDIELFEAQGTEASFWESKDRWREKANEIVAGETPPNVVVTVGSDASSAMIEMNVPGQLAARLGPAFKGLFILGVSDPMRAGYARHDSKTGIPGLAVVRYGSGANDWAATILEALDSKKLSYKPEFIFDKVAPQDSWVAADLATSPLNRTEVKIRGPIEHALRVEDLEPGHVYFAWYALDTLVDEYSSRLSDHIIVPSTYTPKNARNFGVVVSVEDQMVGASGAELVHLALNGSALEDMPIGEPEFRIWINCTAVERKKIPLSPTLKRTQENLTFVGDVDGQPARQDCVHG